MTRRFLQSIIFIGYFLLVGCSDPKSYVVTKLTGDQSEKLAKALTPDEQKKLRGWMFRNAMGGGALPAGTTVSIALREQDEWLELRAAEEAEAAALKQKVEAERKLRREEFAKILSAVLIGKKNSTGEYGKKWVNLEIAYENKSDKDIRGVKGVLKITDIFDDKIMNITWPFDNGVPAKQTVVERGNGVDINQFMDDHIKLWSTDFDKLKSTFEVSTIIFNDGTQINAPE